MLHTISLLSIFHSCNYEKKRKLLCTLSSFLYIFLFQNTPICMPRRPRSSPLLPRAPTRYLLSLSFLGRMFQSYLSLSYKTPKCSTMQKVIRKAVHTNQLVPGNDIPIRFSHVASYGQENIWRVRKLRSLKLHNF